MNQLDLFADPSPTPDHEGASQEPRAARLEFLELTEGFGYGGERATTAPVAIYLHLTYVKPHRSVGPFDCQKDAEAEAHRYGQKHHFASFPLADNAPPGAPRKASERKAGKYAPLPEKVVDAPLGAVRIPSGGDPVRGVTMLHFALAVEQAGCRTLISDGAGGVDWQRAARLANGVLRGVESDRPGLTSDGWRMAAQGVARYLSARGDGERP